MTRGWAAVCCVMQLEAVQLTEASAGAAVAAAVWSEMEQTRACGLKSEQVTASVVRLYLPLNNMLSSSKTAKMICCQAAAGAKRALKPANGP
jgi:hypothetical protein